MPHNHYDTPATGEQNENFQRNQDDPKGKPFSTKQLAANKAHAERETLYHKTEGRRVFHKSEVEEAKAEGWRDVPFYHPKHPKRLITLGDEKPSEAEEAEEIEGDKELDALRSEFEKLFKKAPDKRWGKTRLIEEMTKVE